MRVTLRNARGNIGREDRLVRGGVALSLLMLASFGFFAPGGMGPLSVLFLVPLAYFGLTALVGWDPLYSRAGINTQPAAGARAGSADPVPTDGQARHVLDLTDAPGSLLHR